MLNKYFLNKLINYAYIRFISWINESMMSILMAESEEELKNLFMKVKEEN